MGGSVQYHKPARRYYIQVYWEGERIRIWKHPATQEPFFDRRAADKQLSRIQTEIDAGEFHPKYWLPDSPMLLPEYARSWLKTKDVSAKTLTGYTTAVEKYIAPFFKDKDIRRVRANDLKQFKQWLSVSLAEKGVYNQMSALRTMYRDAYRNEDITRVPPFPKLSLPETIPQYIELEQQETLLRAIPERDRPIFMIGMEYGLRVGEVRAIQRDAVTDGKLTIKRAFSDNTLKTTKTESWREYEITEYASNALAQASMTLSQYVFTRRDGNPYTNKDLNRIWDTACKETGIRTKLYNAFRHSLGCQLLDMGYDMDLVRQQLGHKNAAMTRRYAKRSNPVLTRALESRRGKVITLTTNKPLNKKSR